MAAPTFNDRMFLESERIYASIERGEHPDVEAELLDAKFQASSSGDPQQ